MISNLIIFFFQYFPRYDIFYAHDPQKVCKVGDVVLIKQLPKKLTTTITHEVLEVVYPFGDVTDPITNEKAIRDEFRFVEKLNEKRRTKSLRICYFSGLI